MPNTDVELDDSKLVDKALESIKHGDLAAAEAVLLDVVSRTPVQYQREYMQDGKRHIRFWDINEFTHYVNWTQKHNPPGVDIVWVNCVYPRAFYYLGFLNVKLQRFDKALDFLKLGQALDPINPNFKCEMGQALVGLRRLDEALACYDSVPAVNEDVTAHAFAMATRGRGFVLIEMEKLDEAERAFQASLELEPNNPVALNELEYIAQLREGGPRGASQTVESGQAALTKCALCGQRYENGVLLEVQGVPVAICSSCHSKHAKKWWQFWK